MHSFTKIESMDESFLKVKFLSLVTAEDVASLLGMPYSEISEIFYRAPTHYRYKEFEISKKMGGKRKICSPNKRIKEVQRKLAYILLELYKLKPSVHGFSKNRSIVSNANKHIGKKYIFNIDIKDFFPSIHFGRVKNLFAKKPYSIDDPAATVLAHICCHNNSLPIGAPTSPIISNMICSKMDTAFQNLAKKHNATYTRYADDISFSFTCRSNRLPREIVVTKASGIIPGDKLEEMINSNGFLINESKVRLCSPNNRLEVTGLTVNEFPNVRRKYVQQIKSMIYAWEKFGYENAENEYIKKYYIHKRASDKKPKFINIIKGKLSFLQMVKGQRDAIYINLAKRFNKLIPIDAVPLPYQEKTTEEACVYKAIWVLETAYDDPKKGPIINQGTGFMLKDVGMVTCAHVIADGNEIYKETVAFRCDNTIDKYKINVTHFSKDLDIAILEFKSEDIIKKNGFTSLTLSTEEVEIKKTSVTLFGFPAYKIGQSPYVVSAKVASTYAYKTIKKFEIDTQIREGNSGGPVLNSEYEVVGIAAEGADKGSGNNAVISINELSKTPKI